MAGVSKTNRKLVNKLHTGRSLKAIQAALDRGEITLRQAERLVRAIRTPRRFQRHQGHFAVVMDVAGQYIGEIVSRNRGASWIGRHYGRNYPHDSAEFTQEAGATGFVDTGDRND